MIDDILYERIHNTGEIRKIKQQINENVEVVYSVTIKDGIETHTCTSVTITSGGPPATMTVTVDGTIIVQPPSYDLGDYC